MSLSGTVSSTTGLARSDYAVRARSIQNGAVARSVSLDDRANFALSGLVPATYVLELVDRRGGIVATAGPFNASKSLANLRINFFHFRHPAGWMLLSAATAAGIVAVVVTTGNASPSQ